MTERGIPNWWGNAQKMEALVRARCQYSSDAKALKACGIGKNAGTTLYDVIAWGRGEWTPPDADALETKLAQTFTALWEEARTRGPRPTRGRGGTRKRTPMKASAIETLQTRFNLIGSEWDLQDFGPQRPANGAAHETQPLA